MHPINLGMLVLGKNTVVPCTPKAILALLNEHKIKLSGMKVLIIGRGTTVGRPLSILLSQKQINATVTLAHSATTNLLELLKEADVVVAALGSTHFIKSAMVKKVRPSLMWVSLEHHKDSWVILIQQFQRSAPS